MDQTGSLLRVPAGGECFYREDGDRAIPEMILKQNGTREDEAHILLPLLFGVAEWGKA